MKINNEFTVSAPIEQAWEAMLDLERIAPCLPGAAIQDEKGDGEYDGTMKVKIGPITANYKGTVKYEETDEANHRAVLQATGRDARGQGTASATITSTLQEEGDNTRVSVETDMKLTGRAAQFGRGIAQDVATKMLNRFAECLEEEIAGAPGEGAAATAEPVAEENGSRGGATDQQASPGATIGGTAGRVLSSEDPTVMAGTSVEGSVIAGAEAQEAEVAASSAAAADTGQTAAQQQRPRREPQEAFDIGAAGTSAILRRAAPALVGAGALVVLIWLIRRR